MIMIAAPLSFPLFLPDKVPSLLRGLRVVCVSQSCEPILFQAYLAV